MEPSEISPQQWRALEEDLDFSESTDDDEKPELVHNMVCSSNEKCSICLEPIDSHPCCTLDCGHTFHTRCAIDWFRLGNPSCPLCRCADINAAAQVVDFDDAVRILVQRATNKKAPASLKRAVESLKRKRQDLRNLRSDLRNFEEKSKSVLSEMRKRRKKVCRARIDMERAEAGLVMPRVPFKGVTMPLISYHRQLGPPPPLF